MDRWCSEGVVAEERGGEQAVFEGGGVDEWFEGGAGGAACAEGAVETGVGGVAAADAGEDGTAGVVDDDGGRLEVGGFGAGTGGEGPAEIGEGLVLVAREGLDAGEFGGEGGFGGLLEAGIDGGVDEEAALFDVSGVEEPCQLAPDGVDGPRGPGGRWFGEDFGFRAFGGFCGVAPESSCGHHAVEDHVASADGFFVMAERGEAVGAADDGGEHGGFVDGEADGGFAEVGLGGAFHAVEACAEEDAVEVVFKDLVLGEGGFDAEGEGDFEEFAVEGFRAGEVEAVAGQLHADGAGSLLGTVGEAAVDGAGDAFEVDAVVLVEAVVFSGEEGLDEDRGDAVERDDGTVFAVDAADFGSGGIEDGGAFRHAAECGEIVAGSEPAVEESEGGGGGEAVP
jgi:hypothetical protein